MHTQIVNARIDTQLKKEVDGILARIGLTGPEAIRLFYAQVRNYRGIPFHLTLDEEPNRETRQAIQNALEEKNLETIGSLDDFKKMYEAL